MIDNTTPSLSSSMLHTVVYKVYSIMAGSLLPARSSVTLTSIVVCGNNFVDNCVCFDMLLALWLARKYAKMAFRVSLLFD